ncbi:MAG: hypothetical protein KAS32_25955 [Candidatus Peribacteraceae bacterium]|nr:hypothetical protein [Candidatus Peribacteraceae bacterium]
MSNTNVYRYNPQDVIDSPPVATAVVIEIGDFVCVVSDLVINAAAMADAGDDAANMEAAADAFAGVAMSASKNGDTDPILIAQAGVFEFNQKTAAAIGFGDPVAISPDTTDTDVADQLIVEDSTSPIAVCVKTHDNTTTKTLCKLLPSKIFGTLNT